MRVLVEFCIDADMIECPDFIVKDLESYQGEFSKWLCNEENDHNYWVYKNGEKYGCNYRSEAFVEWLNTFVLNTCAEKARVIDKKLNRDAIKGIPKIFF